MGDVADIENKLAESEGAELKAIEERIRLAQKALVESHSMDDEPWDYDNPKVLQDMIDDGTAWRMEGAVGRAAMAALESGMCFLPLQGHKDYYGNTVPPRTVLKAGTKGTLEHSAAYWDIK